MKIFNKIPRNIAKAQDANNRCYRLFQIVANFDGKLGRQFSESQFMHYKYQILDQTVDADVCKVTLYAKVCGDL